MEAQVVNRDRTRTLVVLKECCGTSARGLNGLRPRAEADGSAAAGDIRTRDGKGTGTCSGADYHAAAIRDIIVLDKNGRIFILGKLQRPRKGLDRRIEVSVPCIISVIRGNVNCRLGIGISNALMDGLARSQTYFPRVGYGIVLITYPFPRDII